MQKTLKSFSNLYPCPEHKPDVPSDWHGWFSECNQKMLSRFLDGSTQVIVELGAWLGVSTKFLLDHAPNATVISIDHWQGSEEHQNKEEFRDRLSRLYETFLVNLWDDRERLIPVRSNSIEGLTLVHQWKIPVDLIYIDASHKYEDVCRDIRTSLELFPASVICGDDWSWEEVRRAVTELAEIKHKKIRVIGDQAWWYSEQATEKNKIPELVSGTEPKNDPRPDSNDEDS